LQRNLLLASHRLLEYVWAFGADSDDSNGDDGDDGNGDDGYGDDGYGDDGYGDDGDDDGISDGDYSSRRTWTSSLAMSMLALKLPPTLSLLLAKSPTKSELSISQSLPWKTLLLPMQGSLMKAFKHALKQALKQALKLTDSHSVQYLYCCDDSRQ
jgi:hypothetical protein